MKRGRLIVIGIIFCVWLAFFAPVLGGRVTFAFRDSGHYYLPLFLWAQNEWSAGRVPLWNPQENCGMPVAAEAASSTFYPGKLIFLPPADPVLAYNLYVAGHVLLAAGGAYLLARSVGASVCGSGLAGLSYAFGGNVLFQYCNVVFLVGAAWLPFALLAGLRLLRTRRARYAVPLALALAALVLGGDPQAAYHAGLLLAVYVLLASWTRWRHSVAGRDAQEPRVAGRDAQEPRVAGRDALAPGAPGGDGQEWGDLPRDKRSPAAERPRDSRRGVLGRLARHRLLLLAGSGLLGILLAAVQVGPSAQWTRQSERAAYEDPRNVFEAITVLARGGRAASEPLSADRQTDRIPAALGAASVADDPGARNTGARSFGADGEDAWRSVGRGLLGRPAEATHASRSYQFSVAPWRYPEFLWPRFAGRLFPVHRRWLQVIPAEGRVWNPSLYVGLLPCILALRAWRLRRGRLSDRWFSALLVLALLAALGWYGIGWLVEEVRVGWLRGDPARPWLGEPVGGLYWWLNTWLPGYVYFRYPAKWMVAASLALSVLAARGWDLSVAGGWNGVRRGFTVVAGLSGLGWLLVQIGRGPFAAALDSVPPDPYFGPLDVQGGLADLTGSFAQALGVSLALLLLIGLRRRLSGTGLASLALLLTAADLVAAHGWSVATAPAALWREPSAAAVADREPPPTDSPADPGKAYRRQAPPGEANGAQALPAGPPPRGRIHRERSRHMLPAAWSRQGDPQRPRRIVRWEHDTLFPKHHLLSDVWLTEAYATIASADYRALLRVARRHGPTLSDGSRAPHRSVLRALGTDRLLLPAGSRFPEATPLPRRPRMAKAQLFQLAEPNSRAWIVRQVERLDPLVAPTRKQREARAEAVFFPTGRTRDFRRTAVVETHFAVPLGPLPSTRPAEMGGPSDSPALSEPLVPSEQTLPSDAERDRCRIVVDTPQRIEMEATLAEPGLLVLSDRYTEDWRAYLTVGNDAPRPLPVYRTNRVMRSVWLPAGRSRVRWVYRPTGFYLGAVVSGATGLVVAGLVIAGRARLLYKES